MTPPAAPAPCLLGCTHRTGDGTAPNPAWPPSLLCTGCETRLAGWMDDIVATYALLPLFAAAGSAPADPAAGKAHAVDAPAPLRLHVLDLLDTRHGRHADGRVAADLRGALGVVESWARLVRETRNITAPAGPATLAGEVRLLVRHLPWVCAQRWVDELCADLRTLAADLRAAVGEYRPRPVGVCQAVVDYVVCAGPLLPTGDGVRCAVCGQLFGARQLALLGRIEAERQASLRTAADLGALLGVSAVTIRQWAARGLVDRCGRDPTGRTLYDPEQVRDAATRASAERAE